MAAFPWGASLRDNELDRKVQAVFNQFPDRSTCWTIGYRKMVALTVDAVHEDTIHGSLCTFHHRSGLHWDGHHAHNAAVRVSGLDNRYPLICKDERILVAGVLKHCSEDGCRIEFQKGATVVHYPAIAAEFHWNILHLFAGGYGGWAQAAEWLQSDNIGFILDRQVFVDWDPKAVRTCAMNHDALVVKAPLEPCSEFVVRQQVIVESAVSDLTVLRTVRMPFNLVATLSPPCVSWSRGGAGGGLDSTHGLALLEGIQMLFATQPVAALFECADEIKAHHHFPVFGALMTLLGFKQAWEQVIPYHYLAHHYRNRWLALWIRSDVPATEVTNLFKLMVPPIVPWHDARYTFCLPQEVQHQLKLSPDQFLTYGELQLLPLGKRARVQSSVTALQVARARIPLPHEPLATLCSSYTQQRNLDRNHLARRGIYASLIEHEGEFLFLDPIRFVALLGTVTDIAIPLNLTHAFQQIGNAISVPHALLGILVMLSSITKQSFPIQECIRKCWLSRIHADVTVLIVEGDYVWIRNVVQFVLSLPKPRFHVVAPNAKVTFLEEVFPIEIGWHLNFRELGALLFQLPPHLMMQIRVEHFSATPAPTDLVLEFLAHDKECDLYLGGYHLCLVQWVEPSTPTLLLDEHDDALGPPSLPGGIPSLPFGPFDPTDLLFTKAIENLENLNCVTSYPGSTFVIVAGSNLWAYTPLGTESQFAARIRTAFSSLVPQERAVIIPLHKNFRWKTGTRGFILRDRDQEGFDDSATVLHEIPLMGGPLDTSDRRYLQEYLSIIPGGLNIDLDNYSTGWEPPRIISGILT